MPTEQQIKELAYSLWEKDGRPEGRDQEYYFNAERLLEEQELAQKAANPSPPVPSPTPLSFKRGRGRR